MTILVAGFVVLCIDLIRKGNVVLAALAIWGLIVFTVTWILESAFPVPVFLGAVLLIRG